MNRKFTALALLTLGLLSYGLYQALEVAPTEATMGDVQRIFYYHVPSFPPLTLCYFTAFVASVLYLVWRKPALDALAVSTAEVGLVFNTVILITGPIWAKPAWGIWWAWDARLTSTLVLWLVFVSYVLVRRFSSAGQAPVISAALAVFGAVDVVFVYMSIRWFRTQHPQPVLGGGAGSGIAPEMLAALLWNMAAFLAFAGLLVWLRYRLERIRQQIEEAHALRALHTSQSVSTPTKAGISS
jgi:heme exporter protein C